MASRTNHSTSTSTIVPTTSAGERRTARPPAANVSPSLGYTLGWRKAERRLPWRRAGAVLPRAGVVAGRRVAGADAFELAARGPAGGVVRAPSPCFGDGWEPWGPPFAPGVFGAAAAASGGMVR